MNSPVYTVPVPGYRYGTVIGKFEDATLNLRSEYHKNKRLRYAEIKLKESDPRPRMNLLCPKIHKQRPIQLLMPNYGQA